MNCDTAHRPVGGVPCFAYRLRYKGARQSVEKVLALPPLTGWLVRKQTHPSGLPDSTAQFFGEPNCTTERFPTLLAARGGETKGGLLLAGVEKTANGRPRQVLQAWVVGDSAEETAAMVRSMEKQVDIIAAIWAERQATS